MTNSKRLKILVVDKKLNYGDYFNGFRKNKFTINSSKNILKYSEEELKEIGVFFIVLYEPRDIIQIVKLAPISKSIIIGTLNNRIFTSFRTIEDYPVVDLSSKFSILSNLLLALSRFN